MQSFTLSEFHRKYTVGPDYYYYFFVVIIVIIIMFYGCDWNTAANNYEETVQAKLNNIAIIVIVIVISLFLKRHPKTKRTRAPAYSRIKGGFPKGVKGSSGPISRIPGGDRVC